jgi:hypothetical protein
MPGGRGAIPRRGIVRRLEIRPPCSGVARESALSAKRTCDSLAGMTKPKSKHFSLRLEDELHDELVVAAEEDNRPTANLIRCVLADWLRRQREGEAA